MPPSPSPRRSSAARTERLASPAGWIGAAALHAGIIAATLFTWSHKLDIADQSPVVPVDLVTLSDKTNVRAMVKQEPKEPPKEEAQPPAPETIQQTAAAPPQQEEPAPPPPEAAAEPVLKKPPPPPAPQQKPDQDQKKDKFDINNIMALLDKRAPAASPAPNAKVGSRNIRGIGDQNLMTADLKSMLVSMIYKCWSPPVGAPNASDLVVDFDVILNSDGSVAKATSDALNSSNSYTRASASAAQRAIYTCQPYKLPADRYSQWREIIPHFDPREMVGQ